MKHADELQTIRYEEREGVARITFARPDQLNALSRRMMRELTDMLVHVHHSHEVRVAILTGEGRAFMAGADIKEYAAQTPAEFDEFQNAGRRLYGTAEENSKPLIAAVNGFALGGGFEMARVCDLVLAASDAKFGLPEVKLGLMPGGGGTFFLPRTLGLGRALDLMLTGRQIGAAELQAWGFVHRICAPTELAAAAWSLALEIAAHPADAVAAIKRIARLGAASPGGAGLNLEFDAISRLYHSDAAQEKIQQFAAKSKK